MAMNTDNDIKSLRHADDLLKRGFASMLQGGVIMDVVTPDQAAVAEAAGAVSVMALREFLLTSEKQEELRELHIRT